MGCDIHGYVEIRDARPKTLSDYPESYVPNWYPVICAGDFLGRDYNLFGVLAGVRWYDPSWEWEPIAMQRGIPEDVSWKVKEEFKEWGCDGHSSTWMLLSEIELWDWNRTITQSLRNPEWDGESDDIFIEKKISLFDYCDEFKVIRELMKVLVGIYGDENVRLVIWFDN